MATQVDDGSIKTIIRSDYSLYRYDQNGALDATFGNGGEAFIGGRDIEVTQTGNRILTLEDEGRSAITVPQSVHALTQDGQPDHTFGDGGEVTLLEPALGNSAAFKDLAIQTDGKIIVTGGGRTVRLMPSGTLDQSFGGDGIVDHKSEESLFNQRVMVDDQGRILVLRCFQGSWYGAELIGGCEMVRLLPGGTQDLSYDPSGNSLLRAHFAQNFEIDSKGRIVIFGRSEEYALTIIRLLQNGAVDTSFGQSGLVTTPAYETGIPTSGALQADDRIVRTGEAPAPSYQMQVWRYLAEAGTAGGGSTGTPPAAVTAMLKGSVTDSRTGAPVSGATIECEGGRTASTGTSGTYSLSLPVGTYSCTASMIGYRAQKARVTVGESGALQNFALRS